MWHQRVLHTMMPTFMRQFFMSLPVDLDDAARIDGCGPRGIPWHIIIIPQSWPALGLVTLLDRFPISRYNIPVTRRIEFVTHRPKTILSKQKRPDRWVWTCFTAYPYRGCQL
jgi:hypothetical protein